MKDNELLELAAKAVGPKVVRKVECSGGFELVELSSGLIWNPLEDDGAALRLAVELMSFNPYKSRGFLACISSDVVETRRAIVLAAVEIGKSMQP